MLGDTSVILTLFWIIIIIIIITTIIIIIITDVAVIVTYMTVLSFQLRLPHLYCYTATGNEVILLPPMG